MTKAPTAAERKAMADQTAAENKSKMEAEGTYVSPSKMVEPPLMNEDPSQSVDLAAEAEKIFAEPTDEEIEEGYTVTAVPRPKGLHAKIAEVILEVQYIQKTGKAPQAMGGYSFVEAGQIAAKLRVALASRGVTLLPEHIEQVGDIIPTIKGSMLLQTVKTTWRLTDSETGESTVIQSMGTGGDAGDKFSPKAQTNAMKYALQVGFLLETGDDPEKFNLNEEEPQGITITGSNIEGVKQGGRQGQATQAQLDSIRKRAADLQLTPGSLVLIVGATLGGNAPDIDNLENPRDQTAAILEFLGNLSFDDCGSIVRAVLDIPDPE